MPSQGPNSGGAFASVTGSPPGVVNWSNVSNAATSNDTYATVTTNDSETSNLLAATNFGFSVPADATIDGITVAVEGKVTGGSGQTPFSVTKNGTSAAVAYGGGGSFTSTDSTVTRGGPSNLLGTTWTPAEVNASTFGVLVYSFTDEFASARTASIDHVTVTVHYTEAATGQPAVRRFGAVRHGPRLIQSRVRVH